MVTQASLHANLALVDQETFLFNDSITNNIRYGSDDAGMDAVTRCGSAGLCGRFHLRYA